MPLRDIDTAGPHGAHSIFFYEGESALRDHPSEFAGTRWFRQIVHRHCSQEAPHRCVTGGEVSNWNRSRGNEISDTAATRLSVLPHSAGTKSWESHELFCPKWKHKRKR